MTGLRLTTQLWFPAPWAFELSRAFLSLGRRPRRSRLPAMQAPARAAIQVTLPSVRENELKRAVVPRSRKCSPFARAKTTNFGKLSKRAYREARTGSLWDVDASALRNLRAERPKTRADCVSGPRPCPFVGCRHHMALNADLERDSLKEVFPELRILDDPEGPGLQYLEEIMGTCALDIADKMDDGTQGIRGLISLYQAASSGKPLGQTPGMTIAEAGRHLNVSVERLRQLSSAALQEMRVKLRRLG